MDDSQRLLDSQGTALERSLLQELRAYRSTGEMRKHTLAALAGTGSAGLAAGGAAAWGKTWGAKLLITVSVASVLVGAPAAYLILRQSPAPSAPATPSTKPPVQPSPSPATAEEPAAMPTVPEAPAPPAPALLTRPARRGMTPGPDLKTELEALDKVRANMGRGDFMESLSLLGIYFQAFHHGRLRLEAEVLRIDALAKSGQAAAARAHAKEFLRRNPKSVHAGRLQSIVGE